MVALFVLGFDSAFATTIGTGQTVTITDPSLAGQNINFDATLTNVPAGPNPPYDSGAGLIDLSPLGDTEHDFTEGLGSGFNQVQWTGSGGFTSSNFTCKVNIGGLATPETLTWGTGGFVPDGSVLVLTGGGTINFENNINLGADASATRQIDVGGSAIFSGQITGSGNLLFQNYGPSPGSNPILHADAALDPTINIAGQLTLSNVYIPLGGIVSAGSYNLTNGSSLATLAQGVSDFTLSGGSIWAIPFGVLPGFVSQTARSLNSTDPTSLIDMEENSSSTELVVQSGYYAGHITEGASSPTLGVGASLTKDGSGIFTLASDNNSATAPLFSHATVPGYTQGTKVKQGTLLVTNTTGSATATGAVLVMASGSLGGSGIIAPAGTSTVTTSGPSAVNDLVVESGGKIDLDAFDPAQSSAASINTLTIGLHATDAATFETGAGFVIDLGPGGTSDAVAFKNLTANVPKVFFNNNQVNLDFLAGAGDGTYTIFTFDQTGAYSGTLQNGPNYTFNYNPTSITVTVNSSSVRGFSEWGAQYPALADGSAVDTPLHDGVPTLLKYLYDINPGLPMSADDRAALPVLGTTSDGTTQYLSLTYRQYSRLDNGSVQVAVETSSDLKTWSVDSAPVDQPTPTGVMDSVTGDPFMVVKTSMTAAKQFIRLRVSMP